MPGFYPAYHRTGATIAAQTLVCASGTTSILIGQCVTNYTSGTGIVPTTAADFAGAVIGVTAEPHDGVTAGRQVGTEVLVYTDPSIVFKTPCDKSFTSTGGSTVAVVAASLNHPSTGAYIGGYLIAVTPDSNAPSGYSARDALKITDSSTSGLITFTPKTTGTWASSTGSTWYIVPGVRMAGYYGYDLTTAANQVNFESTGGLAMTVVGSEFDAQQRKGYLLVQFRLHQFGNLPISS